MSPPPPPPTCVFLEDEMKIMKIYPPTAKITWSPPLGIGKSPRDLLNFSQGVVHWCSWFDSSHKNLKSYKKNYECTIVDVTRCKVFRMLTCTVGFLKFFKLIF